MKNDQPIGYLSTEPDNAVPGDLHDNPTKFISTGRPDGENVASLTETLHVLHPDMPPEEAEQWAKILVQLINQNFKLKHKPEPPVWDFRILYDETLYLL